MKRAGIYRIRIERGDLPPKFYIGQASRFRARWASHLRLLKQGKHWNAALQADFAKYGVHAASFEILLVCQPTREILALYEQIIVDFLLVRKDPQRRRLIDLRPCVKGQKSEDRGFRQRD